MRGVWQISSVSVVLFKFVFNLYDLDPTQFHRRGSTPTWVQVVDQGTYIDSCCFYYFVRNTSEIV